MAHGEPARRPYGTQNLTKIAILMTDGEYNTQYDTNGVSAGRQTQAGVNGSSTDAGARPCARR